MDEAVAVVYVPPHEVPRYAPAIVPLLQRGERYYRDTHGSHAALLELAKAGEVQTFVLRRGDGIGGVVLTEVVEAPCGRRVLRVVYVSAGDMETLVRNMGALDTVARALDCGLIEARARPGWRRLLHRHGYRTAWVVMRRRVENGRGQAAH